jgi:hypothetical protein
MEYTWNIKINKIIPYNIESQQKDLIENISWTITGTKDGKSASAGGCIDYDLDQGVSADTFSEITDLTKETLQSWIETRLGSTRLNEMKTEIEANIDSRPDDYQITPDL